QYMRASTGTDRIHRIGNDAKRLSLLSCSSCLSLLITLASILFIPSVPVDYSSMTFSLVLASEEAKTRQYMRASTGMDRIHGIGNDAKDSRFYPVHPVYPC
ncbi:MAG TPA: hypothetical protein VN937_12115, partial [Blastocatellia bacterium]|nr:hypothetical protein [Blastocatellia bacterium]